MEILVERSLFPPSGECFFVCECGINPTLGLYSPPTLSEAEEANHPRVRHVVDGVPIFSLFCFVSARCVCFTFFLNPSFSNRFRLRFFCFPPPASCHGVKRPTGLSPSCRRPRPSPLSSSFSHAKFSMRSKHVAGRAPPPFSMFFRCHSTFSTFPRPKLPHQASLFSTNCRSAFPLCI